MAKLIVLRRSGILSQGYNVTLEISEEGQRPHIEESGKLPPQPELAKQVE